MRFEVLKRHTYRVTPEMKTAAFQPPSANPFG
jgi:hypothetical protein